MEVKRYALVTCLFILLLKVTTGDDMLTRVSQLETVVYQGRLRMLSIEKQLKSVDGQLQSVDGQLRSVDRQLSDIKTTLDQISGPREPLSNETAITQHVHQMIKDSLTGILSGLVNEHLHGMMTERLASIQAGLAYEKEQRIHIEKMSMEIKEALSNDNSSWILNTLGNKTRRLETRTKMLEQILEEDKEIPVASQKDSLSSVNEDSQVKEAQKSCPSDWQYFQGSCYFIALHSIPRLTFDGAQAKCGSLYPSSSLVALESIEETNFIKQYLQQRYPSIRSHTYNGWMTSGYRVKGQWTWKTTGASINTTAFHWGPGRPATAGPATAALCMSFYQPYQFDMTDTSCGSYPRQIVCEFLSTQ